MSEPLTLGDSALCRAAIVNTRHRVRALKHVSDQERNEIRRSATRAAVAVGLDNARASAAEGDWWPYALGVGTGLALTATGLIAAMRGNLSLVNAPVSDSPLDFFTVLAPSPITPSQIVIVLVVGLFVAAGAYWLGMRDDEVQPIPLQYAWLVPLGLGAVSLAASTSSPAGSTSPDGGDLLPLSSSVYGDPLFQFIGSINWTLYLTGAVLPVLVSSAILVAVNSVRARVAIRRGGIGRPTDGLILEMLNRVEELDRNVDCWQNLAKRRYLVLRYSKGTTVVESHLRRDMNRLYGGTTVRRLGLETRAQLVGSRLREHESALALMVLPQHVGELRLHIEQTLLAASLGDWESFASTATSYPQRAWWRRRARNLALGTAVVAVGVWAPREWLEAVGLETQRSIFMFVGAGMLLSQDLTASRFRELLSSKGP